MDSPTLQAGISLYRCTVAFNIFSLNRTDFSYGLLGLLVHDSCHTYFVVRFIITECANLGSLCSLPV